MIMMDYVLKKKNKKELIEQINNLNYIVIKLYNFQKIMVII